MTLFLLLIALTLKFSYGKKCPTYWDVANKTTMTNFDLSKFIGDGIWYEHYSHDVPIATTGCECVRYQQTALNNSKMSNYNDEYNCRKHSVNNPDITAFNSTLYPNFNISEGGKMSEAVFGSAESEYWVLDQSTDYQYVLVYACQDSDDFVYLFSRNYTTFPQQLHDRWISYLNSKDINTKDVIPIVQDGCW